MISQDQHKLECAARYLLRKPLGKRRLMLKNMERKHGAETMETIKHHLTSEHNKMKTAKIQAKKELKENIQKLNESI